MTSSIHLVTWHHVEIRSFYFLSFFPFILRYWSSVLPTLEFMNVYSHFQKLTRGKFENVSRLIQRTQIVKNSWKHCLKVTGASTYYYYNLIGWVYDGRTKDGRSNWICFSVHSEDESLSIWSRNEIFYLFLRVFCCLQKSAKKLVLVDGFLRKIYVFPIPLTNSRTQIERRDPQPKWKPCCFEGKSTLKDVAKHPLYYSAYYNLIQVLSYTSIDTFLPRDAP